MLINRQYTIISSAGPKLPGVLRSHSKQLVHLSLLGADGKANGQQMFGERTDDGFNFNGSIYRLERVEAPKVADLELVVKFERHLAALHTLQGVAGKAVRNIPFQGVDGSQWLLTMKPKTERKPKTEKVAKKTKPKK